MSTNLQRISEKARQNPTMVFTSLYHHVTDIDNLRDCYWLLPAGKAAGIDHVTKATYGQALEANIADLSVRLKNMGYVPQPKRRAYVPKPGSPKGRPLGISCFEDKMVELAVKRVLEPIFEPMFEDFSYGYRPDRNPHQCVDEIGRTIQRKRVNYVVEADLRGFFDKVGHDWLLRFLKQRVGDPRIERLIIRMLKGGIMEDGLTTATIEGTPQGSILSPLLSNLYLHYVLDLWFQKRVRRGCQGEISMFRYADDFLVCFQYAGDAEKFHGSLDARLGKFSLTIAEEKTRIMPFGRFARDNAKRKGTKPGEFTFLSFTFYCGKARHGGFKVKRKTSRKKFSQSLSRLTDWLRKCRNRYRTSELVSRYITKVRGHLQYFGITDNSDRCSKFLYHAVVLLYKWLNRRSQRKAYTWKTFSPALNHWGWPKARVMVHMNPYSQIPNV